MKNIFFTGATGFLGSYILREFLLKEDIKPILLIRSKVGQSAIPRAEKILRYFFDKDKSKIILKRIKIVEGEIDKPNLGINDKVREELIDTIDEIYHSAAIAEFRVPLDVIRKSNVKGTKNILDLASECKNKGRLKRVNHISTTYVVGTKTGTFYETDLDVGQKFNNTYEQSKFEAELLVQKYRKRGLDITIFRPSILTGDYARGRTSNFKMLYKPLHFFSEELFDAVPGERAAQENLVPVDSAAKAIYLIANENRSTNKTYHISNITTVELGHFIDMASSFFGFKKPELIPLKYFDIDSLTYVQRRLIEPYIPYFHYGTHFDSKNANIILSRKKFRCPAIDDSFLIKLFEFCVESGFIKPKRHYALAG